MANVGFTISLTSEGSNSGPYYIVSYTTGAYYTTVPTGSPAYLPNISSTAIVYIPQAAASASYLAFKLNNGVGGGCELCDNDVILTITGSAPVLTCCTGSILTTAESASLVKITYNSNTGSATCYDCSTVTFQTSSNGFDWGGNKTATCGTSQSVTFNLPTASCPANVTYYRAYQTCTTDSGTVTSSYWATSSFTSATASTCCTPSITSIQPANPETSSVYVYFSTGSGGCCLTCASMSLVSSSDATNYGGTITVPCGTSPFTASAPAQGNTFYYKIQQTCVGATTSSYSVVEAYTNPDPEQTLFEFTGCGRGSGVGEACSDASNNNRIFVSDCDSSTFGVGCAVYTNPAGTILLTGYDYIFMNSANWDINSSTGIVTAYSDPQC